MPKQFRIAFIAALTLAPLALGAQAPAAPSEVELDDDLAFCTALAASIEFEKAAAGLGSETGSRLLTTEVAKGLAYTLATHARTLRYQLEAIEPAHSAFSSAWDRFDGIARSSGMGRSDRVLRMFLPGYGRTESELATMIGCNGDESYGESLCPCAAIPLAHQLAELGQQLRVYIDGRFAEALPEALPVAQALDHASATLHDLLHAIEITIPNLQLTYRGLRDELGSFAEEGEYNAFDRITEEYEALDATVGRCQLDPMGAMPATPSGDLGPHGAHGGHAGSGDHSEHGRSEAGEDTNRDGTGG